MSRTSVRFALSALCVLDTVLIVANAEGKIALAIRVVPVVVVGEIVGAQNVVNVKRAEG